MQPCMMYELHPPTHTTSYSLVDRFFLFSLLKGYLFRLTVFTGMAFFQMINGWCDVTHTKTILIFRQGATPTPLNITLARYEYSDMMSPNDVGAGSVWELNEYLSHYEKFVLFNRSLDSPF